MKLVNLEQVIAELNKPIVTPAFEYEGVQYEESTDPSFYEFKYSIEGNYIRVWDNNEYFNIDLDAEIRAACYYGSKEFGVEYKTPESTEERITNLIKVALEKDFNRSNLIVEWEDSVTLGIFVG